VKPRVNILYLPGTNCHVETQRIFKRVGADTRLIFTTDIVAGVSRLDSADLLCLPGGFAFGDHLGAGNVAGVLLRTMLADQLVAFADRPVIAICNGFQIAVCAGLFGDVELRANLSGTFVNRPHQEHIVADGNDSPWLAGLAGQHLVFPCAHGEGRFFYRKSEPQPAWQVALRYPESSNPDGSLDNIAGITSSNGLVFGLMDHPERALDDETRQGFFENGVKSAL